MKKTSNRILLVTLIVAMAATIAVLVILKVMLSA
jgi:hypothetical protein